MTSLRTLPRSALSLAAVLSASIAACAAQAPEDDLAAGSETDSENVGTTSEALFPRPILDAGAIRLRAFGTVTCRTRDGARTVANPLGGLPIEIAGRRATTADDGRFSIAGLAPAGATVRVTYEAPIASSGVSSRLQIMDELKNTRGESKTLASGRAGFDLGTIELSSLDCELWRLGRATLTDYHAVKGASPPAGKLRIQRWSEIRPATHAFYDYINIAPDWLDTYPTAQGREETMFHEFGHSIRHVADGDEAHWNWDNFRWAYARVHRGDEIFNTQYAFNEGWANYWERARKHPATAFSNPWPSGFDHWNESAIGNRLFADSQLPGASDRVMLEVLEQNPGTIHSLHEFELALFKRLGRAAPATPPACPPLYTDDGATCRRGGQVIAKPSYGRGVGTTPTSCGTGRELDAGLCYANCADGYDGVGPVCWQQCPAGYHDDGAFCRRDGSIISSNNSACPWWDACGLTTNRGCSTCPDGYQNDGCTCRIDPHIFAKASYGRGVGEVPTACAGGMQYDAGLCYTPCRSGYNGVGPVCWGTCPAGYEDDGATCRRPLSILVKY